MVNKEGSMDFAHRLTPSRAHIPWPVPVGGILLVVADALGFLVSLFANAMRCDESCSGTTPVDGEPWWNWIGSWQWTAIWVISGFAVLAAIAGVGFALRHRPVATTVAFGLS